MMETPLKKRKITLEILLKAVELLLEESPDTLLKSLGCVTF